MSAFQILGAAEFQRNLANWGGAVRKAAAAGGYEWGERTMAVSKDGGEGYSGNIVPVDTGTLMSTGHVQKPRIKGKTVIITLGYVGPSSKYAVFVHEIKANYRRPGSGPDYLRGPVDHMKKQITPIVWPHIRRALK